MKKLNEFDEGLALKFMRAMNEKHIYPKNAPYNTRCNDCAMSDFFFCNDLFHVCDFTIMAYDYFFKDKNTKNNE